MREPVATRRRRPRSCTSAPSAAPAWCSRPAGSRPATAPTGGSGAAAPSASGAATGVHGEGEIDAFDEQLDLGAHELADELQALERSNMATMADTFVAALAADLISADDFA